MAGRFDLTLIGDASLQRKLDALAKSSQAKVVRKAMRESAKRIRKAVSEAAPVETGALKKAFARAPVRALPRSRVVTGIGVAMPTREALGIPADAKGYYPYAIEYGVPDRGIPPRSFIRATVDRDKRSERLKIGRDIGRGIIAEAKRVK